LTAKAGLSVVHKTILILGGTGQARDLANVLNKKYRVITSLAGRTRSPLIPAGELRVGGFGGIEALAEYLVGENIDMLVDATHPFAAVISTNAARASALSNVPRIMLQRPPWLPGARDQWEDFPDLQHAAASLNTNARCFLTIGRQELGNFEVRQDVWFLVRMIETPENPLPLAKYQVVTGLPLTHVGDEKNLMQRHNIDTLITKNSGGIQSAAKLEAARELGLRVMMIKRPETPEGKVVETVEAVEQCLRNC
jgi:precorrin-6A/cobalt-precorrin-6A reductase